jgi:hypothetical protein
VNDRPDTLELLRCVSHTLTREILPGAQPEQLYTLRMIANALGIATRELESHDTNAVAEMRGLNTLYALYGALDGKTTPAAELHAYNRHFAQDIRRGAFETSRALEAALRQHLRATAHAKLAAAYPKGLDNLK